MILDPGTNSNPTIEKALDLIEKPGETLENFKVKGLGLKLVLFGLAEIQALRLSKLSGLVYKLEEELLDPAKIRTLEPKMLFGLYNMASKSLTESSEFVERTLKNVNWDEMETGLLQVKSQQATKNDTGIDSDDSAEILSFIAKLKAQKDGEESKGSAN